jgi:hypothetical protein
MDQSKNGFFLNFKKITIFHPIFIAGSSFSQDTRAWNVLNIAWINS